jgi:hypothetical protein
MLFCALVGRDRRARRLPPVAAGSYNELGLVAAQIENRAMLVALVQGVIGAFDKDPRPLEHRRGKKTGQRAKDHFLEKRGVHFETSKASTRDAMRSNASHSLVSPVQGGSAAPPGDAR